jgi:hypothetical protein
MRELSNKITLLKNARGCWDLDTSKGCSSGAAACPGGCYGECYAYRALSRRGYDFSKTVQRGFENESHLYSLISQVKHVDMPFIRIGVTGDPSENWEHTLRVCEKVSQCNMVLHDSYKKAIVIITKHWNNLTEAQLTRISKLDIVINTSVSALDKTHLLRNRLSQYARLKQHCKSVLRIVSCAFNLKSEQGKILNEIQETLFSNEYTLDTILRIGVNNEYVKSGIVKVKKVKFMSTVCYASIKNKRTYFGVCDKCPEMCGINLKP